MKRKQLLLSAFLLMLYIVPAILGPSSIASLRENGPNMTKEFSPSYDYEYEADDQSITSFSDTLPDDVLNYPDLFTWSIMTATDGTGEYLRLNDTDEITIDGDIILYFDIDASGTDVFEGIDYYLNVLTAIGWMAVYNYTSDSWETVTEIDDVWKNGTIYSKDYFEYNVGTYRMSINLTDVLSADYLGVSFKGMTLSSSDGYAESFADVSDWSYMTSTGLGAGEYSITSDGDQATIEILADSSANEYVIYSSTAMAGMSTENYAEIRYSTMTGAAFYCYIQTTTGNGFLAAQTGVVTGETMKSLISAISGISAGGTITLIRIYCDDMPDSTATTIHTHVEYLRVGPCNEMGWQHDGSTTIGITSSDGGTISTDGDNLTLTSDTDASSFEFAFDTTTTQASLCTAYYPFLVVNCTSVSEGDGWKLEQYDGSAWATLQSSYITTGGIYRYNMASLDTYVQKLRFNFTQTAIITFPFIKAYSIANYTYTGTGVSVDDVLYVSDGTLYCQATSITSMILDRDPALSVSTSLGDMWSITTSSGTPQTDYYVGAWAGYSSETEGDLAAGTLTDVRIKFTDSANIAAIIFLSPIPQWNEVNEVQLIFNIPLDEWALNMFLILLGMIMVPASTGYLVYGGKNSFSTDKLLYGLFAFMMGWALIFGGIFS